MHNGSIQNFIQVKRHLRHLLDDDIYHWIQGETDSEHLFALFLQLAKGRDLTQVAVVAELLQETLITISGLVKTYAKAGPSYYNICMTDGQRLIATRYCSDKRYKPESLHYLTESSFIQEAQRHGLSEINGSQPFILVASERLTSFNTEWIEVPANSMIIVEDFRINCIPL